MIKYFRSDFPLILSIENNCSVEQQDRMAKHLVTILGDLLYTKGIKSDEKASFTNVSSKKDPC